MADMAKLAPAFAKLAEAALEISDIFAGGGVLGKRAGEFDENGKKKRKKRGPREPTAFNVFMKKAVPEAKQDEIAHNVPDKEKMKPTEVFAHAARQWKTAPENPKNCLGSLDVGKSKNKALGKNKLAEK